MSVPNHANTATAVPALSEALPTGPLSAFSTAPSTISAAPEIASVRKPRVSAGSIRLTGVP